MRSGSTGAQYSVQSGARSPSDTPSYCRAVLCREEAQELQKVKPKLDAMGVKLVGIVKEWDEAEIKVMYVHSSTPLDCLYHTWLTDRALAG